MRTSGLSQFLGCTPLGAVEWTVVFGAAIVGTAAAAGKNTVKLPFGS